MAAWPAIAAPNRACPPGYRSHLGHVPHLLKCRPTCRRAELSRIRSYATAPDAASAAAATAAAASDLVEWMQQRGCTINDVQLHYEHHSNGHVSRELRASQDLKPGDVLITVPLSCTIHYMDQTAIDSTGTGNSSNSSNSHGSIGRESGSSFNTSGNSGGGSSRVTDDAAYRLAALRRLQADVPAASDSGRGAWQFKVALEVLYQYCHGAASPLHPYIQTLPGASSGIPGPQIAMLYSETELQELQYGPLIQDAASQAYWWKQYSQDVLTKLPETAEDPFQGQLISKEQLGWALSVAMSRSLGFKRPAGWALVPLMDMANHALASNAEIRYDSDHQTVRMIANKQVPAGAPILLKYGSHDNANLLLSYGFVLLDNPADRFSFPLDIDLVLAAICQFVGGDLPPTGRASDGLKQWQRAALQQLGLMAQPNTSASTSSAFSQLPLLQPHAAAFATDRLESPDAGAVYAQSTIRAGQQAQGSKARQVMVSIGSDPPVCSSLLAAVRVVLAADRASVKARSLEELGDWNKPLSKQHEALVMKALVGLCTVQYKSFPTSIQADKAQLQQQQHKQPQAAAGTLEAQLSAERLQTAVQFRLSMKLLLETSTKALLARLKALMQ